MTFRAVRLSVSNKRTSPVVGAGGADGTDPDAKGARRATALATGRPGSCALTMTIMRRRLKVNSDAQSVLTVRVRPVSMVLQELHRGYVVDINLVLQDNDQSFPVHLDVKHRRREYQLAKWSTGAAKVSAVFLPVALGKTRFRVHDL